jgi:RHH-type transcriptional regulator, rel operon repressor / antitoxin RelB
MMTTLHDTMARIPQPLNKRLTSMANKTGRSKAFYVRKAIECYLNDMEDYLSALEAEKKATKRTRFNDIAKRLGLAG